MRAGQIDHPILITECVCNPFQSRSKMAELLFETYGVPSIGINTLCKFYPPSDMLPHWSLVLGSFSSFIISISFLIFFLFISVLTAYGVDAAFSYKYNQQHGVCDKDGLAICPGFTTTHVIPVCFLSGSWYLFNLHNNLYSKKKKYPGLRCACQVLCVLACITSLCDCRYNYKSAVSS